MTNVLVVYGTSYGQTEKIVRRIAASLTVHGFAITAVKGSDLRPTLRFDEFDGFLVAASVMSGHHQRYVETFVRRNLELLRAVPSAFISVSGAAGSPGPDNQAEARRYVEEFFRATSWHPPVSATFGGAMAYTKYNFFLRWITQQVSKRRGGPTDTSRDHETTDWDAVDRFATELVHLFRPAGVTA